MSLPHKNEEYGTEVYWDKRYEQEAEDASFDWFKTYADVANDIRKLIPDKAARILMLGCGNSKFSEDMWEDGYKNIVNVDYSPVVIEKMRNRHKDMRPEMTWEVKDVRTLDGLDTSSFDIAIDKGTMDAMMTSSTDVWDPPEQVIKDCTAEVSQVIRVLKRNGIFIYITFGQPHFRRRYLTGPHVTRSTSLEINQLGESFHYYMYTLRML
ncbi:S-adenosyl-L-methionine-dependent methyltransferase [Suillus cothurnatus]|nr:S-adenosyl-L-methionine-dependent methyltransferase [Suillus cothurnatus]